jgi:hypothetical protein
MSAPTPTRLAALLCLAIPACAQSPSQIPATPSTTPATQSEPALPNRPQVTYAGHQLTVQANNSSLNQILHEISQHAGITITGGVTDERVFGSYGPGSLAQVLNELLDGTSSNMLFVSSVDNKPAQLILTPRTGAPTPPNPNAMQFNNAEADANDNPPVNPPEPPDESSAQTPPAPAPASQSATQASEQPGATNGNNTSAGSSTDSNQQSPNGARTPQQIFDQLMKLRQQQHPQTQ